MSFRATSPYVAIYVPGGDRSIPRQVAPFPDTRHGVLPPMCLHRVETVEIHNTTVVPAAHSVETPGGWRMVTYRAKTTAGIGLPLVTALPAPAPCTGLHEELNTCGVTTVHNSPILLGVGGGSLWERTPARPGQIALGDLRHQGAVL